ncbi:DUF3592 domain-containing protein [Amycolatopsis sp. NPDC098790]|uniref:DUF3592 domain-containing protein n=1 Tax=Amycolatopsis sp. NPDC098790 TaxID=3363939 RepID=UPI003805B022
MDLDGEAVARPTTASRTAWDWAVIGCALLFVGFATGALISLGNGTDALPAWSAATIGSVMLGVLGVVRILDGDRRAAARSDFDPWLPPEEPLGGGRVVDFAEETARLRRSARRAAVFAAVWCAVMAFFVVIGAAGGSRETGTSATGEVVGVVQPNGGSGPRLVRVKIPVDGTTRTVDVAVDDVGGYSAGQVVTVAYDPPGLGNVRLADEHTSSGPAPVGFIVVVLVLLAFVASIAMFEALSWRRRYLAVRQAGWRRAAVTVVVPAPSTNHYLLPDINVRYSDGSTIVLRAAMSTFHGAAKMKDPPERIAWVGGWGRDMVVLFPYRPKEERPYAVPAFALSERENG